MNRKVLKKEFEQGEHNCNSVIEASVVTKPEIFALSLLLFLSFASNPASQGLQL